MTAGVEHEPLIGIEAKPHHNCGVAGVALPENSPVRPAHVVAQLLSHLQHRGPDGAGVVVAPREGQMAEAVYADVGPVSRVLSQSNLDGLSDGEFAIGQVRYPTQGRSGVFGRTALQPVGRVGRNGLEFWLGHNGQFGFEDIEEYPSDTYKATDMIAQRLVGLKPLHEAIAEVFSEIPNSAYSITAMTREGVLAVRDPFGRHPLFYGYSKKVGGFLVASETPALTNLGVKDWESLPNGHMAMFRAGQEPDVSRFVENPGDTTICMLEAIYFARADGMLENKDIYEVSKAAGSLLAIQDKDLEFDVVVPVPDSARAAAQGYAEYSGKPYTEGFVRLGSHRSFLQNDQKEREKVADHKLQIIPSQIRDKRIVLVEDSIVRGTTMTGLVKRLKAFGASEVHLRIASPPVMDSCEYGIDIPTKEELIAYRHKGNVEAIRAELGADSLKYLSVSESRKAVGGKLGQKACMKCFSGRQPKRDFVYTVPFK